jgi:hypothetical protein
MIGIQKTLISRDHSKEGNIPVEDSPTTVVPYVVDEEDSQERRALL